MILPEVSSYSLNQIAEAQKLFPILTDYRRILDRDSTSTLEQLRKTRVNKFVECVLANYFKSATPEAVCRYWSRFSDEVIRSVYAQSNLSRHDITILAVGKLGAEELNLSSDIDLMFLQKENQPIDRRSFSDFLMSLTQKSDFGFFFRVDVDLRPGGRMGPIISTPSQFEDYYGNYGETWERLALIRLRPLLGNQDIIASIESFRKKFCFRKHLDYTLLEDLKTLRSKIQHFYLNQDERSFNLKLGVGGIRDIELYIHALQVIHGGKNPQLQTGSTSKAIQLLQDCKILSFEDAEFLSETYWYYRRLENLVQSKLDQQTHSWKLDSSPLDPQAWREIGARSQKTDLLVSSLIGSASSEIEIPKELPEQFAWLKKHGAHSPKIVEIWPTLIETKVLSSNSQRDERERLIFLQSFILELNRTTQEKDLPILLLADFLKSVRAKASFFSMLNRNPEITKELVWLFSLSPYLSHILISRPELLDSFILKTIEIHTTDINSLIEDLGDNKLLSEIICSSQFLLHKDIGRLTQALSDSADRIVTHLLSKTKEDFPKSQIGILAMGKWSGHELGLNSDLDFIFITPNSPDKDDHAVAKRMITRLTQKNRGGHLYSLDFRLRPSGKAGPIIVSREQLEEFLNKTAKIWERQAYLKSRALGDPSFFPAQYAITKKITEDDRIELMNVKRQLELEPTHGVDLKYSRGALLDIEFNCQWAILNQQIFSRDTSTLGMIHSLSQNSSAWLEHSAGLLKNYLYLRQLEQIKQLVSSAPGSDLNLNQPHIEKIARLFETDPKALLDSVMKVLIENQLTFKSLDPLSPPS